MSKYVPSGGKGTSFCQNMLRQKRKGQVFVKICSVRSERENARRVIGKLDYAAWKKKKHRPDVQLSERLASLPWHHGRGIIFKSYTWNLSELDCVKECTRGLGLNLSLIMPMMIKNLEDDFFPSDFFFSSSRVQKLLPLRRREN